MSLIIVTFELLKMSLIGVQKGIFYKPNGKKLATYLESLGPIFTKFGQLLSTRTDILDIETAKELESLTDSCKPFDVSKFKKIVELDKKRRTTQTNLDNLLAESNLIAKEIGELYKEGNLEKAVLLKEKAAELKSESKIFSDDLNNLIADLNNLLLEVPNIPNKLVPKGNTENDNQEILKEGHIPELHKNALPHWELASKYNIIDFELGNKITGAGFPVYKAVSYTHLTLPTILLV